MKLSVVLVSLFAASALASAAPRLPLPSGNYTFQHKFSEQPNISGMQVLARIEGRHIVMVNKVQSGGFPLGVIAEGTLMWHAGSKQWIIGTAASDRYAKEVGGCSEGPEVVDLHQKIYWTC